LKVQLVEVLEKAHPGQFADRDLPARIGLRRERVRGGLQGESREGNHE
jgi:hypothetical protein